MDAIRTENLTKDFNGVRAVDGLTFTVTEGELFGLVGPDGAGKTTTLRMLTAIMDPSGGDAWVMGHHTRKEGEALKEKSGYMSQRFGLYNDLSVLENIHFYADIYSVPRRGRQERIQRLLQFSGLAPFKNRHAGKLSGGMKQKLGLACTLIHTPRILFLDEPTNGVDPVSRRDFWRILYELLREKVTIFLSTAYLDEAERCGRLALMHRGKFLSMGTPQELKTLMDKAVLEVQTDRSRDAVGALRELFGRDEAGLFGHNVHVYCRDPEACARKAEEFLAIRKIETKSIRTIEPSLEDVFVSMLARREDAR